MVYLAQVYHHNFNQLLINKKKKKISLPALNKNQDHDHHNILELYRRNLHLFQKHHIILLHEDDLKPYGYCTPLTRA